MIQLSYEPVFDPFHAVFRFLRLRQIIEQLGPFHRDLVRILDFYLLFPFRIGEIRLTPSHRRFRKLASVYDSAKSYGDQPEARTVFDRLEVIQGATLDTLASQGFIDADQLSIGLVQTTNASVGEEILERVRNANEREGDLIDFLGVLASEYELTGENGLKSRTGLMEHRYDAI